jgi:hypothetical protein
MLAHMPSKGYIRTWDPFFTTTILLESAYCRSSLHPRNLKMADYDNDYSYLHSVPEHLSEEQPDGDPWIEYQNDDEVEQAGDEYESGSEPENEIKSDPETELESESEPEAKFESSDEEGEDIENSDEEGDDIRNSDDAGEADDDLLKMKSQSTLITKLRS